MWVFFFLPLGKGVFHESKGLYSGNSVANSKVDFCSLENFALSLWHHAEEMLWCLSSSSWLLQDCGLGACTRAGCCAESWTPSAAFLHWPERMCFGLIFFFSVLTLITAMLFQREGCLPWVLGRRQVFPLRSGEFNWRCVCAGPDQGPQGAGFVLFFLILGWL